MIWLEQLIFYVFAALVVFSGLLVITSRNPVQGVLSLVLAFVSSAVLWLMMEAEFLALILIFVYVGAVMTLFLFVVMMLNIDTEPKKKMYTRYSFIGFIVFAVVIGLMGYTLLPSHFGLLEYAKPMSASADYSSTEALGMVLYTVYMYPFEIAALILLVAIISAISLAMPVVRDRKHQRINEQVRVRREDRVELVKMKSEGDNK